MSLLSRFHVYTLDTGAVARALAAAVLREWDDAPLDPTGTTQYIRTRYMRLVAEYGLPAGACNEVAALAWAMVAETLKVPPQPAPRFAFFE